MKYAQRYGRKAGKNRIDLMKIIHYAIIAIHNNDLEMNKNEVINTDQRSSKEL